MQILAVISHPRALPYLIGERIAARGGTCHNINPHRGGVLPAGPVGYDGLLVLGGSMSAANPEFDPVFTPLMELIREIHEVQKPVLGVCLGSQLLARSFDADVYPLNGLEVGYTPLHITESGAADSLLTGLSRRQTIFEWHEDTFDLPNGAELLMSGDNCHHQAFRIGSTSYGFQCHFEVDSRHIEVWIKEGRADLVYYHGVGADEVERDIRRQMTRHVRLSSKFAYHVGDRWIDLISERR